MVVADGWIVLIEIDPRRNHRDFFQRQCKFGHDLGRASSDKAIVI